MMVAEAVIEKIALPIHAMFSSDELFPVLDGVFHSPFPRERNDRMQMIRHKQAQPAMPDESLMVEFHGRQHGIASVCATQLVFSRWHTVDGYKEPTALAHPLRNCVREFLADGQTHARSVITRQS